MSTGSFGNWRNEGFDWRRAVGFVSHDNVVHLWSEKEKKWTPVSKAGLPAKASAPQSEAAQ